MRWGGNEAPRLRQEKNTEVFEHTNIRTKTPWDHDARR